MEGTYPQSPERNRYGDTITPAFARRDSKHADDIAESPSAKPSTKRCHGITITRVPTPVFASYLVHTNAPNSELDCSRWRSGEPGAATTNGKPCSKPANACAVLATAGERLGKPGVKQLAKRVDELRARPGGEQLAKPGSEKLVKPGAEEGTSMQPLPTNVMSESMESIISVMSDCPPPKISDRPLPKIDDSPPPKMSDRPLPKIDDSALPEMPDFPRDAFC